MTNEEAIKVLQTYDMSEDNEDKEFIDAVVMAIKALEQEPVLGKIRAEIEQINDTMGVSYNQYVSKIDVLQIIDKYTKEREETE